MGDKILIITWKNVVAQSLPLRLFVRLRNEFLKNGRSPGKLALTLALGVTIGILPVVWGTTILCAVVAILFRLNPVGIQAVNYLVYPLQLAMFVPFFRLGERIFHWNPSFTLPTHSGSLYSILTVNGVSNIKAIGAWGMFAPFLAFILYYGSLPFFISNDLQRKI